MAYIDDWNAIKQKFADDNDDIKSKLKKAHADLKAEKKKTKPDADAIEDLEYLIESSTAVSKKKTGFSQVLPAYEKLLDKMESMMANNVDPNDKKAWNPYVKALGEINKSNTKAVIAAQKMFGDWEEVTVRVHTKMTKADKVLGTNIQKIFKGKNYPAKVLINELAQLQKNIGKRMSAIQDHLSDGMANW